MAYRILKFRCIEYILELKAYPNRWIFGGFSSTKFNLFHLWCSSKMFLCACVGLFVVAIKLRSEKLEAICIRIEWALKIFIHVHILHPYTFSAALPKWNMKTLCYACKSIKWDPVQTCVQSIDICEFELMFVVFVLLCFYFSPKLQLFNDVVSWNGMFSVFILNLREWRKKTIVINANLTNTFVSFKSGIKQNEAIENTLYFFCFLTRM